MILTKENINSVNLDDLINEKISSDKLNEFLLVVPTNRKLRSLKKELISLHPKKSCGKIHLETLSTLSTKLLSQNINFRPMSDAVSAVLLKQSTIESDLKYFSGYKKEIPSGTMERIKNVLSEYKRNGITPELIEKDAELLSGSEKFKALDIAEIFRLYKTKSEALFVKEVGDIYRELNLLENSEFEKSFRKLYDEVNLVVINGFDEFTQPEVKILNEISKISNLRFFINFDYSSGNAFIFSHLNSCYQHLKDIGFRYVVDTSFNYLDEFRQKIRNKLFLQTDPKKKEKRFADRINIISSETRENEIEIIAREIKMLLSSGKTEPHKICVAFNLIDNYSPAVRDIFSVYGIPFNLTDRFSLKNSFPVNSIINFLEILENDFFYKNIFRALSAGFIDVGNINISGLMKTAAELKIVSGFHNWTSIIQDTLKNKGVDDDEDDYSLSRNLKIYKKALSDIESINELLEPFTKKMNYKEFLVEIRRLIYKLRIPEKLLEDLNKHSEENIKSISFFIETLEEIFGLSDTGNDAGKKFDISYFLEQIRTASLSARYNIKEQSNYGVLVTTMNEIRGLKFDYLFLSGLCDGDFPTRYNPEIFSPKRFTRNESEHQTEERYLFYQSLCSWEKGLYLTYPKKDREKEKVESGFLKDFARIFEVTSGGINNTSEYILTPEELMLAAGKHGIDKILNEFEIKDIDWDKINKAINITQMRRQNPYEESIYNGFLSCQEDGEYKLSQSALDELQDKGNKQFSITQLELYAGCPYQYFLKRILNVEVLKEPTEEIEAFELGTLLHSILAEFYSEINKRNLQLHGCSDSELKIAEDLIFNLAAKKIEKASFNSPLSFYEQEKITGINGNRSNSILYKFLEEERNYKGNFIPKYFELSFGEESSEPTLQDFKIGNVKIRGKIDRIDVNEKQNLLTVTDYKRGGKKPSPDDLEKGFSLQLPLYMYVASEFLKIERGDHYKNAAAYIYSLKYKENEFGKILINSLKKSKTFEDMDIASQTRLIESNMNLIQIAHETINRYVDFIKKGRFNLSELEDKETKICKYCDFRSICRIKDNE